MKRILVKLFVRPLKAFVLELVRTVLIEGSNYLIEGEFSSRVAKALGITDQQVDAVIREFTDGLVEFAESHIEGLFDAKLQPKGDDGV